MLKLNNQYNYAKHEAPLSLYFGSANFYWRWSCSNFKVSNYFCNNLVCISQLLNRTNNRWLTSFGFISWSRLEPCVLQNYDVFENIMHNRTTNNMLDKKICQTLQALNNYSSYFDLNHRIIMYLSSKNIISCNLGAWLLFLSKKGTYLKK